MGGGMYKDSIWRSMEIRIFGFSSGCANRVTESREDSRTLSERTVKILHNEGDTKQSPELYE